MPRRKKLSDIVNKANERINKLNLKEYNKELRRLKRAVSNIEKRGYTFPKLPFKELKQPKPASIERLQNIRTKDLYKYARYETETGYIKGTERLQQERKERAQKAKETRARRKQEALQREELERQQAKADLIAQQVEMEQAQFEREMRERDKEAKRKLREDEEFARKFSEGKIVYEQIMEMIYNVDVTHESAGQSLRRALQEEFDEYGEDAVLMSMANAPQEFIETCDSALTYNPPDERHTMAIMHLYELIKGTALTIEEAQRMQDTIDSDSYENEL